MIRKYGSLSLSLWIFPWIWIYFSNNNNIKCAYCRHMTKKKTKSHFSGGSFVCLLKSWSATTILLTLFFIFFWRHPFPSPFLFFIVTYGNINDKSATTVHFSMNMRGNVLKNWEKTAEISIKSLSQKKAHKNEVKKVYRYDSLCLFLFTYIHLLLLYAHQHSYSTIV